MKKQFFSLIAIILAVLSSYAYGQIGINTALPKVTLDVNVKDPVNGTEAEGLIAPRLTGDQIQARDDQYGTDQMGALIYATSTVTAPTPKTINITAPGYYYFDGSIWQKATGSGSGGTEPWNVTGTTTPATSNVQNIYQTGGVAVGTMSPDPSAKVDITAADKGFLMPRVGLNSNTDVTTIPNPAVGLQVYNTGTGNMKYKGFVFWNGTEWRAMTDRSTIDPVITALNCNSASANPASFLNGTLYNGTLSVPYTGGNGGSYSGGASFTQNGLTFTLNPGTLEVGNGTITYSVTGIPNFSSPNTVNVPISFLGQSCNATIGNDSYIPFVIGEIRSTTIAIPSAIFKTYLSSDTTPYMTGKNVSNTALRNWPISYDMAGAQQIKYIVINGLRMDFLHGWDSGMGDNSASPKLYNTTSNPITYSISSLSTNNSYLEGSTTTIASHHFSYRVDGDDIFGLTPNNTGEYVNVMLVFATGEWFNCTWYAMEDSTTVHLYMTAQRLQ
ncbi:MULTISPECIES: hypothetical protein [Chryseobacterium]|uniref:Uncharacterized protein n=1 Tax=Chryseobacterium geocarposphaerae TaxID=1416776 RepID=A0ABU1LBT7_9FLAO|nr:MULTISPECIES: hypothetical protein [Chryseobacterium]MDR6404060.1 hypothetical protein [Chryseobacterium geocarposphaerae]MDR6698421.1 hypothetical protein [Chryseobacterium ginsenosidimutans]